MFYLYGKRLVRLVIIVSSSTKGAFIPFISRLPCSEKRPQIFGDFKDVNHVRKRQNPLDL